MPLLEPAAVGEAVDAVVATQDLGHRRILREPSVLQQVAAFISKA